LRFRFGSLFSAAAKPGHAQFMEPGFDLNLLTLENLERILGK